ncbi:MAG: alcohol dehydrogenase catalytic domain-containing protein [Desulfatiglandales bacterium]
MKINAAVLRAFKEPLSIEELELAPPAQNEVLIRHVYTGFCHTDLHYMLGEVKVGLPMVLGHETGGVVEEVGPGVSTVKVGDHVVSNFIVSCGTCPECLRGMTHLCSGNMDAFIQGTMLDGTSRLTDKNGQSIKHGLYVSGFATYGVMPERGVVPIRKDMPLDQACLMACCVPTGWGAVSNIAKVLPGDSVAVFGMGGVGLNVLRAAALRQANPLIAVDLEGEREAIAGDFGATHFVNSSKEDPVPVIKKITEGKGADIVFEVIGDPGAVVQAYWSVGKAGKLVIVGVTPQDDVTPLQLFRLPSHQLSILGGLYGSISTHIDIPKLIDLSMKGGLRLDRLVTKKFKLQDINDVADAMVKRRITGRWVCEFD